MPSTKFRRIACADNVNLTDEAYRRLGSLSEDRFQCIDSGSEPESGAVLERIKEADCVLVSWQTRLDSQILSQCPSLKYIGLCASKYTNPEAGNIELAAAQKLGIAVTAVGQYGDEATAEFIFCQLLMLCRGFGKAQWKNLPCELFEKRLGIIGMGAMGTHVLRLARGFGMNVAYNSRTRRPEIEGAGVSYESKSELLRSCDIVSIHVPKGTNVLSAQNFAEIRSGTILVQTSCGIVCDTADLGRWLENAGNFLIMDESVDESYRVFQNARNVLFPPVVAGRTEESRRRLSDQVLGNLEAFLNGTPRNVIN